MSHFAVDGVCLDRTVSNWLCVSSEELSNVYDTSESTRGTLLRVGPHISVDPHLWVFLPHQTTIWDVARWLIPCLIYPTDDVVTKNINGVSTSQMMNPSNQKQFGPKQPPLSQLWVPPNDVSPLNYSQDGSPLDQISNDAWPRDYSQRLLTTRNDVLPLNSTYSSRTEQFGLWQHHFSRSESARGISHSELVRATGSFCTVEWLSKKRVQCTLVTP